MSIAKQIIKSLEHFTESLEAGTVHETHRVTTLVTGQCANCKQRITVYAGSKPPHYCNACLAIRAKLGVTAMQVVHPRHNPICQECEQGDSCAMIEFDGDYYVCKECLEKALAMLREENKEE